MFSPQINQEKLVHFLAKTINTTPDKASKYIEREIIPFVEEWEAARMYPTQKILSGMAKEGLLGMSFPKEYGGQDKDIRYHIVLVEELENTLKKW